MRIAAALLACIGLALACNRDDDLIPLGILALVALAVLGVVTLQLRDARADADAPRKAGSWPSSIGWLRREPANDNANPGRRAS